MLCDTRTFEDVAMVRNFAALGVNVREETKAGLGDANDIARAQFVRFRRRLGTLTQDQESQIEDLLISTVTKISSVTVRVMEALAENSPTKLEAVEKRLETSKIQMIDKSEM
jgi:hypothetical protein